jgi:16S rRNA (uracil1498-N3)-methyltransferase
MPFAVTLALGMPANERMDTLVEKAAELGVAAIQPLVCARSVLRLAGDRAERKREHWQAVAAAASEQSGRTRLPRIEPVLALERWLHGLDPAATCCLLLSPRDGALPLRELPPFGGDWLALSGPEGGLTADEEAAAVQRGFMAVGLGPRVLRADTAPLALLAWLALQRA